MTDPGELRISDADREAAARKLHTAMGEGRISIAELEERLDVVYAARTYADLEPPLADLPVPGAAGHVEKAERVHLRTEMGSLKRTGDWVVPASLALTSGMGSIHLDLTEATSVPLRIEIEVSVGMGEIVIVVPAGATADVDGVRGSWGEISCKVPSRPGASGPHLTISGKAGMGSLKVRGSRTGWKAVFGT